MRMEVRTGAIARTIHVGYDSVGQLSMRIAGVILDKELKPNGIMDMNVRITKNT